MSIVSMLQELTKGETWGNKEQFERNYYEGKKVIHHKYLQQKWTCKGISI